MNGRDRSVVWTSFVLFCFWSKPVFPDSSQSNAVMVPAATYFGTHRSERVSYELAGAGDINGDGYGDFITGNFHTDFGDELNWKNTGSVYLILGKSTGFQMNTSMANTDAHFVGKIKYDAVGNAVAGDGDVNGDGLDDILIGACAGDKVPANPGHAYLVFGRRSANWGHHFVLADSSNASFNGEGAMHLCGFSVSIAGDFNLDGYDDFLISAPNANALKGKAYLFKGKASGWQRGISLAAADAIFWGSSTSFLAGSSVAGVGDVNGDGIPDFAIGDVAGAGKVYLILGKQDMNWGKNFSLDQADVIFTGEENGSSAGAKISRAGDVNADGCDDFLIAAPYYDGYRGKVYLVLGKHTGWLSKNLSEADVSFLGENPGDQAGWGIRGDGDSNGDGCSEILIGSWGNDRIDGSDESGKAYLIKGKKTGWSQTVSLGSVPDFFNGERSYDNAGYAVGLVRDFNHDGSSDFIVSAPYSDTAGDDFGMVYLFLGDRLCWNIEGRVFTLNNVAVPKVPILVDKDALGSMTTDQGTYAVVVKQGKDSVLTPYKMVDEDVGDTVISAYDAALTARHALGLDVLNPDQKKAADVNADGKVLIDDAIEIVRYSVGMKSTGVHRAGDWFFEPPNLDCSNIREDRSNQDFKAYIRGDVDGNWHSDFMKSATSSIAWERLVNIQADTFEIAFRVKTPIPVISVDMALEYNEDACQYLGEMQKETGKKLRLFSSNRQGKLYVGGFAAEPMEGTELFSLIWRIKNIKNFQNDVSLKRLHVNNRRVALDELLWTGISERTKSCAFCLVGNYPNPFNHSTFFELLLHQEEKIKITIYNHRGETVRMLWDHSLSTGKHTFRWDGTNEKGVVLPSGVYVAQVMGDRTKGSLKMLLLK